MHNALVYTFGLWDGSAHGWTARLTTGAVRRAPDSEPIREGSAPLLGELLRSSARHFGSGLAARMEVNQIQHTAVDLVHHHACTNAISKVGIRPFTIWDCESEWVKGGVNVNVRSVWVRVPMANMLLIGHWALTVSQIEGRACVEKCRLPAGF